MNLDPEEFWRLVDEKDANGKRVNKLMYMASMSIDRQPTYGPGSKGGGRIVVCDNCGTARWVDKPKQQFCCRTCKYEYAHAESTPRISKRYVKRHVVHRYCEYCGKKITIKTSDLNKGRGIFCSNRCASLSKGFIPLWFYCNTCGSKFRAFTAAGSTHCCIECKGGDHHSDESLDDAYIVSKPKLVDLEDRYEYIINIQLEDLLAKYRKENRKNDGVEAMGVSRALRMMVVEKTQANDIDDYYLSDSRRKARKLLSLK